MGLFSDTVPFKDQKYKDIKSNCIKKGELFVDQQFPPIGKSLYFSKPAPKDIVWKRPGEIVSSPKFFVDGVSSDDLAQGSLGNCWFVAACACLAEDSKLWKKIVPDFEQQEWSEKNKYAGIFHFKFWRCGQWTDVVIDDYLPTTNGELVFVHSKTKNEFWSALLEKAYAKLAGDYESLKGGFGNEALVDMTGGVGEVITLKNYTSQTQRNDLFRILCHSKENHSLMSSAISATANEREHKLDCGLIEGHAYSITAVKKIKLGTGMFSIFSRDYLMMIRLRNPWGKKEWNGAWSDGSDEWQKVSDSQKKELGLTNADDGEFWMSYEDFCHYFTMVDICHMFNTSFFSLSKRWHEEKVTGTWRQPERCGGCVNHDSFLNNPQFIIDVTEEKDEVLMSLEQKDRRVDMGVDHFHIGFNIRKLLYDEPMSGSCLCFTTKRSEVAATQITLVNADGLKGSGSSADPFCIVKYEGGKVQNHHQSNTLNPDWNDRITLYRKKPDEDITIEIWDHNILKDELMGIATLSMDRPQQYTGETKGYDLFIKGKEGMEKRQGKLWLKVLHTENMDSV